MYELKPEFIILFVSVCLFVLFLPATFAVLFFSHLSPLSSLAFFQTPLSQVRMTHSDHEVLMFGRNVSMGYLYDADITAEAMDDRGWFHSGDIGQADRSGFLYISSRRSDLVLTAGGAQVPPQAVETAVKVKLSRRR